MLSKSKMFYYMEGGRQLIYTQSLEDKSRRLPTVYHITHAQCVTSLGLSDNLSDQILTSVPLYLCQFLMMCRTTFVLIFTEQKIVNNLETMDSYSMLLFSEQ